MRYGRWSSRQRPHNAASSSRAPSVEEKTNVLAERYGLSRTTVTMACADLDGRCPNGASQSSQPRADLN